MEKYKATVLKNKNNKRKIGSHKQGWKSLLTKKSETWLQIQRYVEMMPFLTFGNPWGYRLQGAKLETVSKALES